MEKSKVILTLAFSAIGTRLESLSKVLNVLVEHHNSNFVIVVQNWNEQHKENAFIHPKINYIWDDGKGLSRSRNIALQHVEGDYVWLLDDDVEINIDDLNQLIKEIQIKPTTDCFRVKIACLENANEFYKTYPSVSTIKRINLLQFSSIEIIIKHSFIKQHSICFNEGIGLGTPYQATEEVNFLLDVWNEKAKFTYVNKAFVRHTCNFEGRILATDNIFFIRGVTASRFKFLGLLLLIRWTIRYLIKYKNLTYVTSMIKGFCTGYSRFSLK